jgi:hypothetical protein
MHFCELIHYRLSKEYLFQEKAKPFVRRGRKATGLKEIAGLPKCLTESRVALIGWPGIFLFVEKGG